MLDPVKASDAADFMAMWQDESFARDAGIEATHDLQSLTKALERFAQLNASGLFFKWCIRLKEPRSFIGEIEVYPLKLQTSPWLEWGIGYSLARNYWGQGLMREAIELALNYLFQESLAQRIRADVGPENQRSQHLLRRLGFRLEGLQEAKNLIHGKPVDMQLWAISQMRYFDSVRTSNSAKNA